MTNISTDLLKRRISAVESSANMEGKTVPETTIKSIDGGGSDSHGPSTGERLGRLEGAVEGLKHSQNLLTALVALVAAVVVGFGVYTLQRIDQVNDKVNALPGQIASEIRDLTKSLS